MPKRKKSEETAPVADQDIVNLSGPGGTAAIPLRSTVERKETIDAELARRRKEETDLDIINSFLQASKTGSSMETEIAGIIMDGNDVYWQCIHGPITVRIPFRETFDELPSELLEDNAVNVNIRRRQFLSKSIGLKIRYIITEFRPDPESSSRAIVIGSRVKAMAKIRQHYFGDTATRPVRKGDIYEAQFLSVGDHVAWVSFRGIDVRVRTAELSHRYLPSLTQRYSTGQKIKIMVTHVEMNEKTGMPVVRVSARPIELEESKINHSRAPVGSTWCGTVTSIKKQVKDNQPRIVTSLWLNNVDIPAFSTTQANIGSAVITGTKVYVEVLGYTDAGYAHCKILRLAGPSI